MESKETRVKLEFRAKAKLRCLSPFYWLVKQILAEFTFFLYCRCYRAHSAPIANEIISQKYQTRQNQTFVNKLTLFHISNTF